MKKTAILLGMFIGTSIENKKMYQLNVQDWLDYTPYDIYIFESSGTSIDITHPRLFEFSFYQGYDRIPVATIYNFWYTKGPTIPEKNSLLRLFKYYPTLFNYDMVFKVTGKYFCPTFMTEYEKLPKYDMIIQHSHIISKLRIITFSIFIIGLYLYIKHKWSINISICSLLLLYISFIYSYENTELIGASPRILHELFSLIQDHSIEYTLYQFIICKNIKVYRLPPLQIARKAARNDGSIYTYL